MAAPSKLIIYFFSGTGNSQNVAIWLSEFAEDNKISTEIFNIADMQRRTIPVPDPNALLVFISPVHGFNYPPVMINFLLHFPKGKNKVLLLNTRAGMLIGKFITPGLSGITFYFAALVLKLKKYSIKAMFPIDLPSNWISVHPGLNQKTVEYLHLKNRERVMKFADAVLSGRNYFKSAREIIQDMLMAPIALGYYMAGRFLFAKTYYASQDCNNCYLCIKQCPVKAIKKVNGRPFWTFNCESCMHCMSHCPKKAIETAHGSIALLAIAFTGLTGLFYADLLALLPRGFNNLLTNTILKTLVFMGLLAIWYRITHLLLRFRFFERIMVYTSFTKYKFWGRRYKALSNGKLNT